MGAGVNYTFKVLVMREEARVGHGITEEEARDEVKKEYPEVVRVLDVIWAPLKNTRP